MDSKQNLKNRICFIDEIRGLAVFCMIFYHAFYLFDSFFGWEWAEKMFYFFMPLQPIFAGIFIFICGISCTFSKNNLKRGLVLLGVAIGFTVVTAVVMPVLGFVDCEIYFGILHFLSVGIIIHSLLSKWKNKLTPAVGVILCAVLYAFTSTVENGYLSYGDLLYLEIPDVLYGYDYLMPLGIHSPGFYSADYFPLVPDIFIFFAGVFCGSYFLQKGYPQWSRSERIRFFGFLGRHALPIYVVHMPAVYAVGYLINLFLI